MSLRIPLDAARIANFCEKWKIVEFALFGSVTRADFRSDSDVDVLVTFAEDAQWTLLDHVEMQDELSGVLARKVDLVSKKGIVRSANYIRREAILNSAEVVYAA
ncbi:MAG: nucleotidyltransferase family protein [Armatimonadota bacterium]